MRLTREVRFQVTGDSGEPGPALNSWAGWPSRAGIAPYLVVRVTVVGHPDPQTGYICNISAMDRLIRQRGIRAVNRLWADAGPRNTPGGGALMRVLWSAIGDDPPPGTSWDLLQCRVTPFLSFEIRSENWAMVHTTQCFEFSASHRLFRPDWPEERNREVFGKCDNPNGHGHNYQVEVTVPGDPDGGNLAALEWVVKTEVIDRFDHKHLNLDCEEFTSLNPTVENITRVIWDRLAGKLGRAALTRVRVWETPKTYAECCGPPNG